MKNWFKYEFGYVNIDSESLYLTNSGNWSETKTLTEKTNKVTTQNNTKASKNRSFILTILVLFCFLIFNSFMNGKVSLTLILLLGFGGYKVYTYLKTEIGPAFKIPLRKLTALKFEDATVELVFLNHENTMESYHLKQVDENGITILKQLNTYPIS